MTFPSLTCPKCQRRVVEAAMGPPRMAECSGCGSLLQVEVFPALFRPAASAAPNDVVLVEGESTCFYHANKKAVLPCEGCGRFLCALCDCELNGEHFCPACLEAGKTKGKIRNLENRRTMYDNIALALAILPIATVAFWFLTFITAPAALFVAIRFWKAPLSIVRHSRIRY